MLSRAAAAAVLVLAIGCGGEPTLMAPVRAETPQPGFLDQYVRATLRVEVSGAETVDVETETTVHIIEIMGERQPQLAWFLSVSVGEVVQLADGRALQYAVDLAPGLYKGAGTYTLTPEPPRAAPDRQGLASAAYILLITLEPERVGVRYDRLVEPCTLTVAEAAVSGTVRCPALANADGDTIATEWEWERL